MDTQYLENRITKLLNEMSSIFTDIQVREEVVSLNPANDDLRYQIVDMEDDFCNLARSVYKSTIVYLECIALKEYLNEFKSKIQPYLEENQKILTEKHHNETGENYSEFVSLVWSYLSPFPAFGFDDEFLLKRTGITYLENILESTGVIIKALEKSPKSETQVYKAVKLVSQATFPAATFPTESFQKTAKCYIPDILIPSLNCAIEYKYAESETDLIRTIDEILIDVKGYAKNPTYKLFYAVFYVKPGIWVRKRFDQVWKEKEFPENWKGIFVEGV